MPLVLPSNNFPRGRIQRGLTHWWPLDGFSSNQKIAYPAVGNIYGTETSVTLSDGPTGSAADSSYLSANPSSILLNAAPHGGLISVPLTNFSICGWVYLNSLTSRDASSLRFICWGQKTGDSDNEILIGSGGSAAGNGDLEIKVVSLGTTTISGTAAASTLATGQWYHFALTWSGGGTLAATATYLNGLSLSMSAGGNLSSTANTFAIGTRDATTRLTDGRFADVMYFRGTVLTAAEVLDLYNSYFLSVEEMPALFVASAAGSPVGLANYDLPVQTPRLDQTWTWRQVGMIGQDQIPFGIRSFDPPPTPPPRLEQTWTWRQVSMMGLDRLPFGGRTSDVTPPQPYRIEQTTTWRQVGMIGQDRLPFGGTVHYDTPIYPPRIEQTTTWRQVGMLGLDVLPFGGKHDTLPSQPSRIDQSWIWRQVDKIGVDTLPTGGRTSYDLPAQPPRIEQTWTWRPISLTLVISVPFNQFDWPLPARASPIDQFWGWRQTGMIGQDRLPFRQSDWPNQTQPPRIDQSWLWRQVDKIGLDKMPFRQTDWQLPYAWTMPRIEQTTAFRSPYLVAIIPPPVTGIHEQPIINGYLGRMWVR